MSSLPATLITVFGNQKKIIIGISIITYTLFAISVSIASFVIGRNIWDVMCDNNSFMPLPIWVMTTGCINFVYSTVSAILYFIKHTEPIRPLGILALVAGFFVIPFAVMGTLLMAQYSGLCFEQSYQLWTISMTALITNWIEVVTIITLIVFFVADLIDKYRNKVQVA